MKALIARLAELQPHGIPQRQPVSIAFHLVRIGFVEELDFERALKFVRRVLRVPAHGRN